MNVSVIWSWFCSNISSGWFTSSFPTAAERHSLLTFHAITNHTFFRRKHSPESKAVYSVFALQYLNTNKGDNPLRKCEEKNHGARQLLLRMNVCARTPRSRSSSTLGKMASLHMCASHYKNSYPCHILPPSGKLDPVPLDLYRNETKCSFRTQQGFNRYKIH